MDQTPSLERARAALRDTFGFDDFRPGQEAVVSTLLAGRSALAVFPTGGGKSLCYQLPALLLDGLTLVVSPLLALMKDQVDALRARGVAAARLDSTVSAQELREVREAARRGDLKLLYVAPERLGNERFLAWIAGLDVSLLAVDEAHCISEWGHNFRPDYLKLARFARERRVPRVLALTATATPEVSAAIRRAFAIRAEDHVQTGFHRPNLHLAVTTAHGGSRRARILERLRERPGAAVVYVTTQRESERLAEQLEAGGVDAAPYHAGLTAVARAATQEAFMEGRVRVVVATVAFGMGIDKPDIRTVIHARLPKSLEEYAQQVGRAGRDGEPARCELFPAVIDLTMLEGFVHGDTPGEGALAGLLGELLEGPEVFSVSRWDLAARHDIRPLVVATALTYLELEGVLVSTGAFYSGYELRLHHRDLGTLDEDTASLAEGLLARARRARTWSYLEVESAAADLGVTRARAVATLGELQAQGVITLRTRGLRHGYRRHPDRADFDAVLEELRRRFSLRESQDQHRLEEVARYVRGTGCLTRHLVGYFGEELPGEACGHCADCAAGEGTSRRFVTESSRLLDADRMEVLRSIRLLDHEVLASPRSLARFACGIRSPAATRARLHRHRLFGALRGARFLAVLEAARSLFAGTTARVAA